jgi:hypothetical protein
VGVVRLEGIHRARTRGLEYHHLFRGGPGFWKTGDSAVGSPDYHRVYCEVLDPVTEAKTANAATTKAIVDGFLSSLEFTIKRERTREDYRLRAGRLVQRFGELGLRAWEDPSSCRDFIIRRNIWDNSPK